MRCYVLSGISRVIIDEIIRRNIKSIDLRSAHNVATALRVDAGEKVLLTPVKTHDLGRGVGGVIAEVVGKEVMSQSIFYSTPHYVEECEMTVVRLKLAPKGVGRIISIRLGKILETIEAEVIEMTHLNAI